MRTLALGRSTVIITPVVMGLWQAGKEYWTDIDDQAIARAIAAALEAGITTFDTAEEYGGGHSEKALGQALRGKRERAIILSKVFSNHLKYDQVIAACHASLRHLQTDYLDSYQIHWPSGSWESEVVPIEETMRALQDLKNQGKIRSIGVSNFSLAQLKEAQAVGPVDSLQSPYSLYWRFLETEILSYCAHQSITLLAYSPLAQGLLTGRFGAGHRFAEGDNRRANKLMEPATYAAVQTSLAGLRRLAEQKGVSLTQLALAWVLRRKNAAAICGVRSAAQIQENAAAAAMSLSASEVEAIEAITRPVSDRFLSDSVPWFWNP